MTAAEMTQIPGFYILQPKEFKLPDDSITVPLIPIKKTSGWRMVAQLPTKNLARQGLSLPELPYGMEGLDMRTVILSTAAAFANAPSKASIISLDLANAYARIYAPTSRLYTKTKDGRYVHLKQPIQGLASAGTMAPAVMASFFKRLIRKTRKHLRKVYSREVYIHGTSYSDNCILVTDAPEDAFQYILQTWGTLINTDQSHILTDNTSTILGLRWSIKPHGLIIRRPAKIKSIEKSKHYDFIFGRRPLMRIEANQPLKLYCDGVSIDHHATSTAGFFQQERVITALTEQRRDIDQLLAEAKSLMIAQELRYAIRRPQMEIFTDSEILTKIAASPNPRTTLEYGAIGSIQGMKHVPGTDNKADPLSRDPALIKQFIRKRPRTAVYSGPTSPTRPSSPNAKRGPWKEEPVNRELDDSDREDSIDNINISRSRSISAEEELENV